MFANLPRQKHKLIYVNFKNYCRFTGDRYRTVFGMYYIQVKMQCPLYRIWLLNDIIFLLSLLRKSILICQQLLKGTAHNLYNVSPWILHIKCGFILPQLYRVPNLLTTCPNNSLTKFLRLRGCKCNMEEATVGIVLLSECNGLFWALVLGANKFEELNPYPVTGGEKGNLAFLEGAVEDFFALVRYGS